MVGIKRSLGLFFIRSLVFVSFMGLCCAAYAKQCDDGYSQCCDANNKLSCCHTRYDEKGRAYSYDISKCLDKTDIIDWDPIVTNPIEPEPFYPIEPDCDLGDVQYKPDGTCGTSSRTCCSTGKWSGWDELCSIENQQKCSITSKPKTSQSCYGGYQSRTVRCDMSKGTWVTGPWGKCDCSDSAFESVPLSDGGTCCQRKDGTGMRCMTGQETVGHRWESFGTSYNCTGSCPVGTPVAGAACPDSWAGAYCTTHHSWTNRGEEICNQFYCR